MTTIRLNIVEQGSPTVIPDIDNLNYKMLNQFLVDNSIGILNKIRGEEIYRIKYKDETCKLCKKLCNSTKAKIENNFIYFFCDNIKEDICMATVPIDTNFLANSDLDIIDKMFINIQEYGENQDVGLVNMVVGTFGNILRRNGNTIYVYNGTTRLWSSCNSPEHCAYIISHYADKILTQVDERLDNMDVDDNVQSKELKTKYKTKINNLRTTVKKMTKMGKIMRIVTNLLVPLDTPAGSPYYFPIRGSKVVDLKAGEIMDREPYHYFYTESKYTYLGKNHPCPNMDKFMHSLFNGKDEVEYMQTLLGYFLSADIHDRSYYIFWGNGHNGKSVLLEIMAKILGPFHCTLMTSALIGKTGSGATPELVPLIGSRLASISELAQGERLNTSLIKRITTDDTVTARPLYGSPIEFKNKAKIVMVTNHPPILDYDTAICDRTKFIPFINRFVDKDSYDKLEDKTNYGIKDPEFIEDLMRNHMDEIFTYLVNGAIKYFTVGLNIPESFAAARSEYLDEQDYVKSFIDERCEVAPHLKTKSTDILKEYNDWAVGVGTSQLNVRTIKKELEQRGYKYKKYRGTMHVYGLEIGPNELAGI